MSATVLIENARILDPGSGRDRAGAILVEDGRIADIVEGAAPGVPAGAERIDAGGLMACPGLIDMRVFTGEPGLDYRETLDSASRAAAAGGVTSIVVMPDTDPVIDDPALVDFLARRASATARVRVLPSAALTRGTKGSEITEYGLLAQAGAVCFTDGRRSIQDSAILRAAMTYATNFDRPVVHLPCDGALAAGGQMNAGPLASFMGLKGIAPEAETIPLDRDLQLARATGCRYHAAQISCAASAEILARRKHGENPISAGISINNLCLNENDVGGYRTYFKLAPPLRHEDDRQAMIAALRAGVIDTIHSDHDPQDVEGKRQPFAEAAAGAVGLETLLAAALRLYHAGEIELMTLLRALTVRPAQILGLETGRLVRGAPADIAIVDLEKPWVVAESALHSRSRNTAFENARMMGKTVRTLVGGETVYFEGAS